ncbi:MAG: SH3 domain-containing protein [Candidatus Euphemobacter frigidus]|nr:SH3 domain-containing protein [Candidatus Euphemobacter frigidus]MDP8274980.1 SH3 domain-containing protein [Candidatus Euphemobacter frigidus]
MKWFSALAFFPLLFPSAFGEVSSLPATVTGDNVNLRVSPSRRSEIVGQLQRGEEVRVLLTDGEWCAIVPPPGISAWVSNDYLHDGVVTGSRVNVRSGPGVSYGRLTFLRRGMSVKVLKERGGWAKIELPATGRLWVSARYISRAGEDIVSRQKPVQSFEEVGAVSPPSTAPGRAYIPISPVRVESAVSSSTVRSYTGFIRKLDLGFTTANREYTFEMLKTRYDPTAIGFLTGETIDLNRYQSRKVRLWVVILEKKVGHPALMEVKGAGLLW